MKNPKVVGRAVLRYTAHGEEYYEDWRIGDIVWGRDTSNHGCSSIYRYEIVGFGPPESVTVKVLNAPGCGSCWQTGCNDWSERTEDLGKIFMRPVECFEKL